MLLGTIEHGTNYLERRELFLPIASEYRWMRQEGRTILWCCGNYLRASE
jgi:hypothetical protein